jgi:hypothetical protein
VDVALDPVEREALVQEAEVAVLQWDLGGVCESEGCVFARKIWEMRDARCAMGEGKGDVPFVR